MKKFLSLIFLILLCSFLFAENDANSISKQGVRIQIQEFAYPFVPNAGKFVTEVPISLFINDGFLSRTNTRVWYLASSPLFIPDPFYEIGFEAEYSLIYNEKSTLSVGLGTAFSQENKITSVPLINSIRWKWFPQNWLGIQASMENLLYGEGDIIDTHLMANFKPFDFGLLFQIGGTGAIAYGWTEEIFAYSYGLSAGLG